MALPDSRLQRVSQFGSLISRQLHNKPAAAFQRDAHHDAAALLGHLERAIARPRLHRRHPASPSSRARTNGPRRRDARAVLRGPRAPTASRGPYQAGPAKRDWPQQPCRSVALLSRVRTQNGNDRQRAPPRNPRQTARRHRPRAFGQAARRPDKLPGPRVVRPRPMRISTTAVTTHLPAICLCDVASASFSMITKEKCAYRKLFLRDHEKRAERQTAVSALVRGTHHLQQCSGFPLSTLGGAGNRTRVLQYLTRSSPSAACICFSQPRRSRRQDADGLSHCLMS
jgi:hypothetical protein